MFFLSRNYKYISIFIVTKKYISNKYNKYIFTNKLLLKVYIRLQKINFFDILLSIIVRRKFYYGL